jgi:NADPH-dependent 7-cyano-7-deazaguanine reductase QueF
MSIVRNLSPEVGPETVTITAPIQHLCPFADEVDEGEVTVVFLVSDCTFELHALAEYFNGFAETPISHEALTSRVFDELASLDGPEVVGVSSTWTTASMSVRVKRGRA